MWTQDQYKQDIAQNQAKVDAINKEDHPSSSDLKMRGQYESKISQDKAGIQHIDDLVGTFNSYSKMVGGPQIDESAKKTIDDTKGRVRGAQGTLGQAQYSQLSNFSFGAFASETAVQTAAGGVIGKAGGLAFKAASPYLSKLFAGAAGLFGRAAEEAGALPKCFAAGTKVATPQGEKNIEDIKKGDTVYAYDFDSKKVVERKVLDTVRNFTYHWADVQIGNEVIHATCTHKFWVESENQWVEAAHLRTGLTLRLEDGRIQLIKAVKIRDLVKPDSTYNFIVQNEHDYFVGQHQVLVHNGYPESPQYPPPTQVGENFQFNFDTSPNYRNSRAAGVAQARAQGLIDPTDIGHHINSVQTHPNLAAEPSNIAPEASTGSHLDTHGGNWRTPTTGPLNGACP